MDSTQKYHLVPASYIDDQTTLHYLRWKGYGGTYHKRIIAKLEAIKLQFPAIEIPINKTER